MLASPRVEWKVSKGREVLWAILLIESIGWIISPVAFAAGKVPPPAKHLIGFEDLENATDAYGAFAISPDGGAIAFVQRDCVFVKATGNHSSLQKLGVGFS